MPTYDKWVLNRFAWKTGIVTVTILRGRTDFFLDKPGSSTTGTIVLDNDCRFLRLAPEEITKEVNDTEPEITPESIRLKFNDLTRFHGLAYPGVGTPVDVQFDPGETLMSHIFGDADILYTVFLTITPHGGGAAECLFIGEIDPKQITYGDALGHAQSTNDEELQTTADATAYQLSMRLKRITVGEFVAAVNSTHYISPNAPFFAGFTPQEAAGDLPYYLGEFYKGGGGSGKLDWADRIMGGAWDNYVTVAGYREQNEVPGAYSGIFPTGTWGIPLWKVFELAAELAEMDAFFQTDFVPALRPWVNRFDQGAGYYIDESLHDEPHNIAIAYNYVFAVSPQDGNEMEFPISFNWRTPIAEVVKKFAFDWGCYIYPTIDSVNMRVGFRVLPRDRDNGEIPDYWKGPAIPHKEEPVHVGKTQIVVKNKGAEGGVRVWLSGGSKSQDSNKEMTIETHLRARRWGSSFAPDTWLNHHLILNNKWELSKQFLGWKRHDEGSEGNVNPDSWVTAACYFHWFQEETPNVGYPDGYNDDIWDTPNGLNSSARGFYQLSAVSESEGVTVNRWNTLLGPALFYAAEFLGNRTSIERTYPGARDDAGAFNTIGPGLRGTWRHKNEIRTFRAMRTVQNIRYDRCTVKWREAIPYSESDFVWEWIAGDNATGSSNGGGATGANANLVIERLTVRDGGKIRAQCVTRTAARLPLAAYPGRDVLCLVVEGGTTTGSINDNGLWLISGAGVATQIQGKLKYGAEVIARDSEAGDGPVSVPAGGAGYYGINSIWHLYDNLTSENVETEITPIANPQYWQMQEAIRSTLGTDGSSLFNRTIGGLLVRSQGDANTAADSIRSYFTQDDHPTSGQRVLVLNLGLDLATIQSLIETFAPVPPCVNGRYSRSWLSQNVTGGGVYTLINIGTDDYCSSTNETGDVISYIPWTLLPPLEGYYAIGFQIRGTLSLTFPVTEVTIRLVHNHGAGVVTTDILDRRHVDNTITGELFLSGVIQSLYCDGIDDTLQIGIEYAAAGPIDVIANNDCVVWWHYVGNCPRCDVP